MPRHESHNQRHELAGAPSPARIRMWRAMRMLKAGFSVRELLALAAVPRKAAEKFLLPLTRAEYLRAEGAGSARRYLLIRDTGPIPPRVGRAGKVLDVNEAIANDRARHGALLKEISALEARMTRFGAYVEKFQSIFREAANA